MMERFSAVKYVQSGGVVVVRVFTSQSGELTEAIHSQPRRASSINVKWVLHLAHQFILDNSVEQESAASQTVGVKNSYRFFTCVAIVHFLYQTVHLREYQVFIACGKPK